MAVGVLFILVQLALANDLERDRRNVAHVAHRMKIDPPCTSVGRGCDRKGYKNFDDLLEWFERVHDRYPHLTKISTFGYSTENRPLVMLEISDKPGDQTEFEPNIKLVANMHGDEVVGQTLLILLTSHLLENYETDLTMKQIVDSNHIFIIPSLNPDGFSSCRRENGRGVDLNRNFPDRIIDGVSSPIGREPETVALMNISQQIHFTLSTNMHGGDVVVNYPFDAGTGGAVHSKDEDIFIDISLTYSTPNVPMYNSHDFHHGITNGAMWYVLHGGMQDWNYVWAGCMEFTLELSCYKWPPFSEIPEYWEDNKESLIAFLQIPNKKGVRGLVLDSFTGDAVEGVITVEGRPFQVFSDSLTGKYFRILLPGTYTLVAEARGYKTLSKTVVINEGELSIINFELESLSAVPDHKRKPKKPSKADGEEVIQIEENPEEESLPNGHQQENTISIYGLSLFIFALSAFSLLFLLVIRRRRSSNTTIMFHV